MGLFDRVWATCPQCGTQHEFQSKGGVCYMMDYQLETAPLEVLGDINKGFDCEECGRTYVIQIFIISKVV